MPEQPEYQFDPIDIDPDVAVGIALPFSGKNSVFQLNYTTEEQAVSNLINLILTRQGERIMQPTFGWGGWALLFEQQTNDFATQLESSFKATVSYWLPYISIKNVTVTSSPDDHTIYMSAKFSVDPSGANQTITIELSSDGVSITQE